MSPAGVRSFFAELSRRKVLKASTVYLVAAFAVMEVTSNFFPALHLAEADQTLVAALLILGFPVAVALAWALEITPSGIRWQTRAGPAPTSAAEAGAGQATTPRAPVALLAPHPDRIWSIAVLPFADLSPAKDQGFFVEGVTEEIRHALTRIEGLSVVARSSSLAFRDTALDVRQIGGQLGVSAVLEGSLRKWKDRMVVTTQLVSVVDGFELWSQTYDTNSDDVLIVQGQIADALVQALGPRMLPAGPIIRGHTADPAAHQAFLKGRHLYEQPSRADLERAIDFFRQATELDSGYAGAHVGAADAYINLARFGFAPAAVAMPEARAAALRALSIDPELAAAHKSLGVVLHRFDWNSGGAEAAFRNAVALNSGYAGARYALGEFLLVAGRFEEAAEVLVLAQDLDPVSTVGSSSLVSAYSLLGQYDRAIRQAEDALSLNPRSAVAHKAMGQLRHRLGHYDHALEMLQQAKLLDPADPEILAALAVTHAARGAPAEGARLRQELRRLADREWAVPYFEAAMAAANGETGSAYAALEKCCAARVFNLVRITTDASFDSVRGDARFQSILARFGSGGRPTPVAAAEDQRGEGELH
ncbi:MAG: tetratricopeptide repeat protein [Gemmatimonadetes bacterium]|nr:tetratricopeptide repeat protein [Gemmatimonadota bacterium]